MAPAANLPPLPMTPGAKLAIDINNTGGKFAATANDTGGKIGHRYQQHRRQICQRSMTPGATNGITIRLLTP
jgi:hypothetical protein